MTSFSKAGTFWPDYIKSFQHSSARRRLLSLEKKPRALTKTGKGEKQVLRLNWFCSPMSSSCALAEGCEIRRAAEWDPGRCPDPGSAFSWLPRSPAGQRGGTASYHRSRHPETRLHGVLPHSRRSAYPGASMRQIKQIFKSFTESWCQCRTIALSVPPLQWLKPSSQV